jgi:hypothetical protein
MDEYIKHALADAEISGIIAEQHEVLDDIGAVRDAEKAVTSLKDRCVRAAHLEMNIGLRCVDGSIIQGLCVDVGDGYVVVSEGDQIRQAVPFAFVVEVHGLPDALAGEWVKPLQLLGSFRSVVRRIDGFCRVRRVDGSHLSGVIEAVGNDHLEITNPDGYRCVVPLTAVTSVWWMQ